jgi:hypothetical protein
MWSPFNKSDVGRYMRAAELYERVSRPKGRRQGILGHVGLEVLRELLRLVDFSTGRLEPSIDYLQARLKRSRAAVVRALKALRFAGFLDWIRRYDATGHVGRGVQVKQISNAYRLSLPKAAERLLGLFGRPAPLSADLAHASAERAQQIKSWMFEDSPLGAAFAAWGLIVGKRESASRSESANGLI